MNALKIFVTGANGFVGKALCEELKKRNISYNSGVRKSINTEQVSYGDLATFNNWQTILKDVNVIIHLAARVHVMKETAINPIESFRKINVDATLKLARAAKEIGVKRFIYLSSIKVNGEQTTLPFKASDTPNPKDAYAISKLEAEEGLSLLHEIGIFEVVIIRPPLVYGPGVKANFEKLFYVVKKNIPIPFGRVANKRSLVSIFNLIDLIILCSYHLKAAGEIFLVSDDHDMSLKEMILEMGKVLEKKPLLIPIPVPFMKLAATLLGKKAFAHRLFGNLQVDIVKTKYLLDWKPQYDFRYTFK